MSKKNMQCSASSGVVYGLGFVGAVIYYISTASGIGAGLVGILKAILWPTFLVYELMGYLDL